MGFNGNNGNNGNENSRRWKREKRRRKNSLFFFSFPISLILIGLTFLLLVGPLGELGRGKKSKNLSQDRDFRFSPIERSIEAKEKYQPDYWFSEKPIIERDEVPDYSFSEKPIIKEEKRRDELPDYSFSKKPVIIKEEILEIQKLITELEKLSSVESEMVNEIEQRLNRLEKLL